MSGAASAQNRTWTIEGGAFTDGATFSGSFNYDDLTDVYSNWNIVTTPGVLPGFNYNTANSYAFPNQLSTNSVAFLTNITTDSYLNLAFASELSSAGSYAFLPQNWNPNANSYLGSWECDNCTIVRGVMSGQVTSVVSGVPEPDTWAMLLVGFGAIGYSMRRRRNGMAQLQAA